MLTRKIILRYRAPGHVRFQLPPQLCRPPAAQELVAALRQVDGVYRVRLGGNKLSIRYHEPFVSFQELARHLHRIVTELERSGKLEARSPAPRRPLLARVKGSRPVLWIRNQLQALRETATAFGILARRGVLGKGGAIIEDPRKFAFEFANDVLVLYLIKVHWHRIVHDWLPHPVRNRYNWAAVFYLTYLLVKSRLPKH
ncbi:hypothetical protein MIT9_P0803 [Methylomarinovum caldicuralii]|uniref:Uncharacterized protein n=1 Tax=Methylomarinovum caldicuralii TaxID=438856 RepID=A0AAU9C242_9GAMM|nr:hypothetical protein [Methylomarinovum caldicuralii]BCX81225.1 hypothetical protein MIT9_P0803 [Methylomarinovum caldicuralii]